LAEQRYLFLAEVDEVLQVRVFSVARDDFVRECFVQERLHRVWKHETSHRDEHLQKEEHQQEERVLKTTKSTTINTLREKNLNIVWFENDYFQKLSFFVQFQFHKLEFYAC